MQPFEFKDYKIFDMFNNGIYKNWQPHWMFVGEIIAAEDKR